MKIEDLIELLKNRLNSFKLSRDYAVMSGNLEGANVAEIEIAGIQDTLYKLNLINDASTNIASVTSANLSGTVNGYDITSYATDPLHEKKIVDILNLMGKMNTVEDINLYINSKAANSPVTGEMILNAAKEYAVDVRLMMAIMELDSSFGTLGIAVNTLNPGNVGNDDDGNIRNYKTWQEGVSAVAEWLNRHRVIQAATTTAATTTPEIEVPRTETSTTTAATTTPEIEVPRTETSTTTAATATPEIEVPRTETSTTTAATTTPEIEVPRTETSTTTQ